MSLKTRIKSKKGEGNYLGVGISIVISLILGGLVLFAFIYSMRENYANNIMQQQSEIVVNNENALMEQGVTYNNDVVYETVAETTT